VKNIGKPCAGKLHARFDEGGHLPSDGAHLLVTQERQSYHPLNYLIPRDHPRAACAHDALPLTRPASSASPPTTPDGARSTRAADVRRCSWTLKGSRSREKRQGRRGHLDGSSRLGDVGKFLQGAEQDSHTSAGNLPTDSRPVRRQTVLTPPDSQILTDPAAGVHCGRAGLGGD